LLPFLLRHYLDALAKLLGQLKALQRSAGQIADQTVMDPWVRYRFELECFLLSGMAAPETIAPEMALMFGERTGAVIDYPAVVHETSQPVTVPRNVWMISLPSVWDPQLDPAGHPVVHAHTLESAAGWVKDAD
jgi:hypothetical protein